MLNDDVLLVSNNVRFTHCLFLCDAIDIVIFVGFLNSMNMTFEHRCSQKTNSFHYSVSMNKEARISFADKSGAVVLILAILLIKCHTIFDQLKVLSTKTM